MSLNIFKTQSGLDVCHLFKPSVQHHGQDKLMIYLNGLTQTISSWGAQSQFFQNHSNQLFYDIPGQGRSSRLSEPLTLQQQANILQQLVEHVLKNNFSTPTNHPLKLFVIGFSFGSRVLLEYLWQQHQYPNTQLHAIAIVGNSHAYTPEQVEMFTRWRYFLEQKPKQSTDDMMKDFFKNVLPDTIGQKYLSKNTHLYKFMESAFLQRNNAQSLRVLLDSIIHNLPTSNPPTISVPTLLLRGEHDTLCLRGNLESLQTYFPNSEIIEIPDAGHTVAIEKAAEFNQLMLQYLEGHHEHGSKWKN